MPEASVISQPMSSAQVQPFAYPLDEFYAQARRALPPIVAVPGESVPEPAKTLLVHERDMTPTLERFYGGEVRLEVLRRQQRGDFYFREVLLFAGPEGKLVEFGAIKIHLNLFPAGARQDILAEQLPLGAVLEKWKIPHTSRPKAFLKIESDPFTNTIFDLEGRQTLYGRRNTLFDPQLRPLAEIVEILPPAKPQV